MADKIAVLRLGQLEQFGTPLELYNRPRNLFVAGFIGSPRMNFVTGTVTSDRAVMKLDTGETLALPDTGFSQKPGEPVTLGIRPNHLRQAEDGIGIDVKSVEQLGGESYVYGAMGDGAALTLHLPGQTDIAVGDQLLVAPQTSEIHLFDSDSGLSLRLT